MWNTQKKIRKCNFYLYDTDDGDDDDNDDGDDGDDDGDDEDDYFDNDDDDEDDLPVQDWLAPSYPASQTQFVLPFVIVIDPVTQFEHNPSPL